MKVKALTPLQSKARLSKSQNLIKARAAKVKKKQSKMQAKLKIRKKFGLQDLKGLLQSSKTINEFGNPELKKTVEKSLLCKQIVSMIGKVPSSDQDDLWDRISILANSASVILINNCKSIYWDFIYIASAFNFTLNKARIITFADFLEKCCQVEDGVIALWMSGPAKINGQLKPIHIKEIVWRLARLILI